MQENQNKNPFFSNQQGNKIKKYAPLLLVLLIFLIPWLSTLFSSRENNGLISYDKFLDYAQNGNISSVTISGEKITGNIQASTERTDSTSFITYFPSRVSEELIGNLRQENIVINTAPSEKENGFFSIVMNLLPLILMVVIFSFLYRRMRGSQGGGQNMFSIGQNKAKRFKESKVKTTFDDVAGVDSAKYELQEIVEFLKNPDKFTRFGAVTPKGVLLVGSPGTGKTLLARAVAGEAEVPFFHITGSDFMEMFVGVGASRVRNLFAEAKKNKPSIIFIDELDSIGRIRGAGLGGGHDEREQTLNQLLSEMDGFEKTESIIVIAATNRPDILDPALQRPGRFDRKVTVNLPTLKDRHAILQIHAKGKPFADDIDLEATAKNTPGFSGADLENLLNEASLLAASKERDNILREDLQMARDKILLGLERKNLILTDREKKIISYHEIGHALVGAVLPNTDPVHKVTIIPRERAMGSTQQLPERDRYLYEQNYLLDTIKMMMGGRAAEQFKLETVTSGAENDLKQAQSLARRMVLDWGMSKKFAHVAMGGEKRHVFLGENISEKREYSEETNKQIDEEVRAIISDAYNDAYRILENHTDALDRFAEELMEKETIDGTILYDYLGKGEKDA